MTITKTKMLGLIGRINRHRDAIAKHRDLLRNAIAAFSEYV